MILFINACVRRESRTYRLAVHLLSQYKEPVCELCLKDVKFPAVDEAFLQKRDAAFNELRAAAGDGGPELLLGAEVRFFDGISAADELPTLCLEGTKLLLIEMPFTRWTERMLGEITEICRRGLIPVAAHLERYLSFNPKKIIRRFMDMDILIQCNAEFFLERRTERKALALMREGRIHFLGSDAHNLTSRAPNLGPALALIEKKLGREAVERLLRVEEKAGFGRESVPQ